MEYVFLEFHDIIVAMETRTCYGKNTPYKETNATHHGNN